MGTDVASGPPVVVQVEGLRKTYRSRRHGQAGRTEVVAVDGVDLGVRAGELLVLLGPSGCGKTTLLRSIAGLETPDRGRITLADQVVYCSTAQTCVLPEHRRIGMMFQSYALWPHMTVRENVAYPLTSPLHRTLSPAQVQQQVTAMLGQLGLTGLENRYPGELSGGQQQRVALARALVAAPRVMLFDEPLSNVDARARRRIRTLIRELTKEKQFAGVYVTHDQEEAMELADNLVVMESGKLRQSGSPADVYHRPRSMYVAQFLGDLNQLPGRIATVGQGTMSVLTALGELNVPLPGTPVAAGEEGTIVIRPEHVRLASAPAEVAAADPWHQAVIREVLFLGSRVEIWAQCPQMEVLISTTGSHHESSHFAPGSSVHIQFPPRRLLWLPA